MDLSAADVIDYQAPKGWLTLYDQKTNQRFQIPIGVSLEKFGKFMEGYAHEFEQFLYEKSIEYEHGRLIFLHQFGQREWGWRTRDMNRESVISVLRQIRAWVLQQGGTTVLYPNAPIHVRAGYTDHPDFSTRELVSPQPDSDRCLSLKPDKNTQSKNSSGDTIPYDQPDGWLTLRDERTERRYQLPVMVDQEEFRQLIGGGEQETMIQHTLEPQYGVMDPEQEGRCWGWSTYEMTREELIEVVRKLRVWLVEQERRDIIDEDAPIHVRPVIGSNTQEIAEIISPRATQPSRQPVR